MPFYDNWAVHDVSKLGNLLESWKANNIIKRINISTSNSKTFLELGPGRGYINNVCTKNKIDYYAIDLNIYILNLIISANRILTKLPQIPIKEEFFDIVYAANVLEHMKDFSEAYHLLEEMKRVTRCDGVVCLLVPDALALGVHFWNGDYSHSFFTSKRRVAQMFRDLNLDILYIDHFSMGFNGLLARIISFIGFIIPSFVFDYGADINSRIIKRFYSLKTDMLGTILIIGKKSESSK